MGKITVKEQRWNQMESMLQELSLKAAETFRSVVELEGP